MYKNCSVKPQRFDIVLPFSDFRMQAIFDHPEALAFCLTLDSNSAKGLVFRNPIFEGVPNALLLEQFNLYQLAKDKLPSLVSTGYWVFPDRIAIEQSTSEALARWKAKTFFAQPAPFWDACAGLGSDTFFMAHLQEEVQVWEPDPARAKALKFHLRLAGFERFLVHQNLFPETNSSKVQPPDPGYYFYADPDRRPKPGQRIASWLEAQPSLHQLAAWAEETKARFLVKLSPMDDGESVLEVFPQFEKLYVVSLHNEVKELLLYRDFSRPHPGCIQRFAVEIRHDQSWAKIPVMETFTNTFSEVSPIKGSIILDPWATLRKSNYSRSVAQEMHLSCISENARLFQTHQLIQDWPGRMFRILEVFDSVAQAAKQVRGKDLHVISRSFPVSASDLVRRYKWVERGSLFLICFENLKQKRYVLLCERIENSWSEEFWQK
jgi:hypothetical protein